MRRAINRDGPNWMQSGYFDRVTQPAGRQKPLSFAPKATDSARVPRSGMLQRGAKRVQWGAEDDRTRGSPLLEDGGRGGDRSVQPLKKIRTDERTKTAKERPSTTEGAAKRPRGGLRPPRRPKGRRRRLRRRMRWPASDCGRKEYTTRRRRGRRLLPSLTSCGGLLFTGGHRTGATSEPACNGARVTLRSARRRRRRRHRRRCLAEL